MAKKNNSIFHSMGWKVGMKYLYGIGAAVVIVGALFKILHLPGANEMLIIGLGTEAVIFFFSAFEPLPEEETHWDWAKVFPVLLSEQEVDIAKVEDAEVGAALGGGGGFGGPAVKLDQRDAEKLVESQKQLPEVFASLAKSIEGLKTNVNQLADITDATVATSEFASKLKQASGKVDQISQGLTPTVEAMKAFSSGINEVKAYQDSIKTVTGSLNALTKVYDQELEDSKKHIQAASQTFTAVGKVMQNLLDTSKDTDALRQEVVKLNTNLKSLNTIYGGMLTAMRQG